MIFRPSKSAAGRHSVTITAAIRPDLRRHLRDFVADAPGALVFTGAKGAALRRSNVQRAAGWSASVAAAGLPGFHFYDLRHTGTPSLPARVPALPTSWRAWARAGPRAALIYQHARAERDKSIAGALSASIAEERDRARSGHARRTKR